MDESPETLRELAQYLRNSTQLFPTPRARKAYEWLTVKAAQADDHAAAWEADRKRLRAPRPMDQEKTAWGGLRSGWLNAPPIRRRAPATSSARCAWPARMCENEGPELEAVRRRRCVHFTFRCPSSAGHRRYRRHT